MRNLVNSKRCYQTYGQTKSGQSRRFGMTFSTTAAAAVKILTIGRRYAGTENLSCTSCIPLSSRGSHREADTCETGQCGDDNN